MGCNGVCQLVASRCKNSHQQETLMATLRLLVLVRIVKYLNSYADHTQEKPIA
jgi:hypothetical protein